MCASCALRFAARLRSRAAAAAAAADLKLADTIWENLVLRTIGETVNADEWTKLVGVRMSKKVGAAAAGRAAGPGARAAY